MSIWAVGIGVCFGFAIGVTIGLWAESKMDDFLAKFERVQS